MEEKTFKIFCPRCEKDTGYELKESLILGFICNTLCPHCGQLLGQWTFVDDSDKTTLL